MDNLPRIDTKTLGDIPMRFKTILATTAVLAGLTLSAAPATALSCPSGHMCMWGDRDYLTNGVATRYVKFTPTYARANLANNNYEGSSRNANNDVTSFYNRSTTTNAAIYTNANCTGSIAVVYRGSGTARLDTADLGYIFNNAVTSAKFIAGDQPTTGC